MANQMSGRILLIKPTESINTKKGTIFTKREIVLDCTRFDPYTGERGFENTPVFEFSGEKCSLLDQFKVGDVVTISFDIQGTKGTQGDRYFNSVRGFKIEPRQTNYATPQQASANEGNNPYGNGTAPMAQAAPQQSYPPYQGAPSRPNYDAYNEPPF